MGLMPYRCGNCGRQRLEAWGGFCVCGSATWEAVDNPILTGVRVSRLDDDDDSHIGRIEAPGPLLEALAGVPTDGARVLVGGAPGAGKSTLVAQAASGLARARRCLVWWLDQDQIKRSAIRVLFRRTDSPYDAVRLVEGSDWSKAIAAVPLTPSVMVIDALQPWVKHNLNEALRLLEHLKERAAKLAKKKLPGQVVFVICEVNGEGGVYGPTSYEHAVEAIAMVYPDAVEVPEKCRWVKTPRRALRE